tara:strand:+ start:131 stop:1273 length:1143 start_codon:yes stop_codon:yes gene_type:complete
MRFDSSLFWHHWGRVPWQQQLEENRIYAKALEELGFEAAWVCEHHFWHDGNFACTPNPILTNADIAAHTSRIRLGQSPVTIPVWHPLRVAEDIALLDHMTGGRVEFGVGRGFVNRWCGQLNPDADMRNEDRAFALFCESLDIILKAWREDSFSHQGEFYTIPEPGWHETDPNVALEPPHYKPDGEYVSVSVLPKPLQQPHPPVYQMVTSSPRSIEFAASRGAAIMCSSRPVAAMKPDWQLYANRRSEASGETYSLGQGCSIQFGTYIAPTREQAFKDVRAGYNFAMAGIPVRRDKLRAAMLGAGALAEVDLELDDFDFAIKHGMLMVGSPDDVAEKIADYQAGINLNHFQQFPSIPHLDFKQAMTSLELLGTRVMPQINH